MAGSGCKRVEPVLDRVSHCTPVCDSAPHVRAHVVRQRLATSQRFASQRLAHIDSRTSGEQMQT
eukprot:3370596-Rhodomonas_salina.1